MPSTQIKLDHGNKTLDRVFDCGHRKEGIGVCHEARGCRQLSSQFAATAGSRELWAYLVMRSSMDLGSRMKVGSTTRLRSAPGRNCEMMCERTGLVSASAAFLGKSAYHFPVRAQRSRLPRSGRTPPWTIYLDGRGCQTQSWCWERAAWSFGAWKQSEMAEKTLTGHGCTAETRDRHGCFRKLVE